MSVMEQLLAKTEERSRHVEQPQETLGRRVLRARSVYEL